MQTQKKEIVLGISQSGSQWVDAVAMVDVVDESILMENYQ